MFAWMPGPGEMAVLLLLGVLLFGRKLPEIGRYLGKGIIEFKKGLKGLEDDAETGGSSSAPVQQAPVLEPPLNRSMSHGLRAIGNGRSAVSSPVPVPNSQVLSLPRRTAPTLRSR